MQRCLPSGECWRTTPGAEQPPRAVHGILLPPSPSKLCLQTVHDRDEIEPVAVPGDEVRTEPQGPLDAGRDDGLELGGALHWRASVPAVWITR